MNIQVFSKTFMDAAEDDLIFIVPLTLQAHFRAQMLRQSYGTASDGAASERGDRPSPDELLSPPINKGKQVYLNGLAVQAVATYLGWLGFEADIDASDSWNPIVQTLADVADLVLPQAGRLECRPVLPGAADCFVPPETWGDRIGYVAVQFNPALTEATLLGFLPTVSISPVPLSDWRSLDALILHLHSLRSIAQSAANLVEANREPAEPTKPTDLDEVVQLGQWLRGTITSSWQTLEELLNVQQPAMTSRRLASLDLATDSATPSTSVIRGRLLTVGDANAVVVIVRLSLADVAQAESAIDVHVTICPPRRETYLPDGLLIEILDAAGQAVMVAEAATTENIQLSFGGDRGEQFDLNMTLGEAIATERFRL